MASLANFDYIGTAGEYPFEVNGGFLPIITGNAVIKQSIAQILGIARGSMFTNPYFGSNLFRLLHEPADVVVISAGTTFIVEALKEWEGRIDVIDVGGEVVSTTTGEIRFNITYRIRASNEIDTFVFPFYRDLQF